MVHHHQGGLSSFVECVCGSNVFVFFVFCFGFFAVSLPLLPVLLLLFPFLLSYLYESVMDFLRFFYVYQNWFAHFSSSWVHQYVAYLYKHLLLLPLVIAVVVFMLPLYELFFHILPRLLSLLLCFVLFHFLFGFIYICVVFNTALESLKRKKINEKQHSLSKTNCLLFQFLCFIFISYDYRRSMRHNINGSHTMIWIEMKLFVWIFFVFYFLDFAAHRSFQLKSVVFLLSNNFRRKKEAENMKQIFCVRIRTLCVDGKIRRLYENKQTTYNSLPHQTIYVCNSFDASSSSFINFSSINTNWPTLIHTYMPSHSIWKTFRLSCLISFDLNSVSHLSNYYCTQTNAMKRKSQ